ncbi:hypothetical protein BST36_12315 [Mycolicibacterium moriokaense]|jgi:hypothetical protein|nr:hypothetical protein BST36_12315 [Mycolicibacterium moriokaense]
MMNRIKIASAGVGMAAVVAMGVLGVAMTTNDEGTATVGEGPEITLGETTTSSTGQTEIETPSASPEVTAEPAPTP